jgi:hypothetical protein
MSPAIELDVGGVRLRVFSLGRFGDVTLGDYKVGNAVLVLLASPDALMEDSLSPATLFRKYCPRGLLTSVRHDHLPALALDLAPVAHWSAEKLQQGLRVDVACLSHRSPCP